MATLQTTTCFLCHSIFPNIKSEVPITQAQVLFFFVKVLEVPYSTVTEYLQKSSPAGAQFCVNCQSLVGECWTVEQQLCALNQKWSECQNKVKEVIQVNSAVKREAGAEKLVKNANLLKDQNKIYKCLQCNLTVDRRHMRSHLREHEVEQETYKCSTCDRIFRSHKDLDDHVAKKHKVATHCDRCGKRVKGDESLRVHLWERHQVGGIMCKEPGCKKLLASKAEAKRHVVMDHQNKEPEYKCPECGKEFHLNRSLYKHRKKAHRKGTSKDLRGVVDQLTQMNLS